MSDGDAKVLERARKVVDDFDAEVRGKTMDTETIRVELSKRIASAILNARREERETISEQVKKLVTQFKMIGEDLAERNGAEKMRTAVLTAIRERQIGESR
jgi:hypothetical protein